MGVYNIDGFIDATLISMLSMVINDKNFPLPTKTEDKMKDLKHDLELLHEKYQSYITVADSFDDGFPWQKEAWMHKAGFVARLIAYLEEYQKMKEAEDDKR